MYQFIKEYEETFCWNPKDEASHEIQRAGY
jgi:hypothetical protein